MRGLGKLAPFALLAAILCAAAPASAQQDIKIENILARPLAASEGQFLEAALKAPAKGSCEMLSPDPGFREEMLLDVSSIGSPGGRKYERRVALVVGNGAYETVSKLTNPPNDATSMAKMFRALGFTVYRAVDATEKSLDDCFAKFKGDLERSDLAGAKADIALFFYAGHGVQLTSAADNEKRNYMLSVDAAVDPTTGKAKGFRQIDRVLTEMRAHSKQAVFLYDACRNSPYGEGVVKEADGQPVRQYDASGAAMIDADESERASQAGLFIAYATSPGKTADDAWGPQGSTHSPFTEALLKNLPQAGAGIEEALVDAYYDVGKLTDGQQTPWTSSSLQDRLQLNGRLSRIEAGVSSREQAQKSAAASSAGLKQTGLALALKALPAAWLEDQAAIPFREGRAALFRSVHDDHARIQADASGVRFSADGDQLISFTDQGQISVWNPESALEVSVLQLGPFAVLEAALSPDGRRVAFVRTGRSNEPTAVQTVHLWDAQARTELFNLSGHESRVLSVNFSHDGKSVLTTSLDGSARLWSAESGKEALKIDVGRIPASACSNTSPGNETKTRHAIDASFTIDDKYLTIISDGGQVSVWEANTGAAVSVSEEGAGVVAAHYDTAGRRLLIASADATVRVCPRVAAAIRLEQPDALSSADFSPDGRHLIATTSAGALRVWRVDNGKFVLERRGSKRFDADRGEPLEFASFSDDGRRSLAMMGGEIQVWPSVNAKEIFRFKSVGSGPSGKSLEYSRDGNTIFISSQKPNRVTQIDGSTGVAIGLIEKAVITAPGSVSSDANLMAVPRDRMAVVLDMLSGKDRKLFSGHRDFVKTASLNSDGTGLVTASDDGTARVWSVETGATRHILDHGGAACAVFDPSQGGVATNSTNGTLRIWSPSGKLEREISYLKDFTPEADGDQLDRAWEIIAAKQTARRSSKSCPLFAGGTRVIQAVGDRIKIWYLSGEGLSAETVSNGGNNAVISASRDGRRIISADSSAASATLWDAATGELLFRFTGHGDVMDPDSERAMYDAGVGLSDVQSAAFHPAGKRVATVGSDGTVRIWDAGLYGPELLEAAYALLTDEQRAEVERERIRYWEVDPQLLQ